MIKIISMDFDGTLLTSNKTISDRTKKCLLDYKKKSYKLIGVTARNLLSVKNILDVNIFDYIILNNGSDIYYVKENRIENVSCIEKEIAKKIYDLYEDKASQIDFCTPYKYLIKSDKKGDSRTFIKYIDGFNDVKESISRMNVFIDNVEELEQNIEFLKKEFVGLNVVKMLDTDKSNSKKWLTINPANVNKLTTLKKICEDLNSSIEETIFFGDGENDLVLIKNAGIGVAMENAIEIVKENAKYVTLSNDNDGIADYLENVLSKMQ